MKRKNGKKLPGFEVHGVKPGKAKEIATDVWVVNPVWYLLDPPEPPSKNGGKPKKKK